MNIKGQHALEGENQIQVKKKRNKGWQKTQSMEALMERDKSEDTSVHYSLWKKR